MRDRQPHERRNTMVFCLWLIADWKPESYFVYYVWTLINLHLVYEMIPTK